MTAKIKDQPNNREKVKLVQPIEKICFGFSHMTRNKNYTFDNVAVGNKSAAYEALLNKLNYLCRIDIGEAGRRGKKLGAERIEYKQLSASFQRVCDTSAIVSKDSKVVVFQFGKHNNYRLICKDDLNHSNLMHIIGFDFDFSAYDHG